MNTAKCESNAVKHPRSQRELLRAWDKLGKLRAEGDRAGDLVQEIEEALDDRKTSSV